MDAKLGQIRLSSSGADDAVAITSKALESAEESGVLGYAIGSSSGGAYGFGNQPLGRCKTEQDQTGDRMKCSRFFTS